MTQAFWRLGFFSFLLFVVGVLFAACSGVELGFVRFIPGADFTGHLAIYGTLALFWGQAFGGAPETETGFWNPLHWPRRHHVLVAMVMLEELSQLWWTHRTFSPSDLLANGLGLWLGLALAGRISFGMESLSCPAVSKRKSFRCEV